MLIYMSVVFFDHNADWSMFFRSIVLLLLFGLSHAAFAFDVPEQYRAGVVIAGGEKMPPMAFIGLNGEPKGYLVDFWNKWSRETGVPVLFQLGNWNEALEKVKSGKADIHIGLFDIEARRPFLDFSTGIYPVSLVLVVPRESAVRSLSDMGGMRLAVMAKGAGVFKIAKEYPDIVLEKYPTAEALIDDFVSGKAEGMVTEMHNIFYHLGRLDRLADFEQREVVLSRQLHAGVKKGNAELLDLINRGFLQIDDMERERIMDTWYVADSSISGSLKIGAALVGCVFVIGVLVLFLSGRRKYSGQ